MLWAVLPLMMIDHPLLHMTRPLGFCPFYLLLVLVGLVGFFTATDAAIGQVPAASIRGRVADSSDAVIAGAVLTVQEKQTGAKRTTATQADGRYQVENLEPGDYEIEVRAQGFRSELRRLALRVGDNATINIELQVGQLSEQVEVTGKALGINTTDFKVDGSVGRLQIENLPLNGRNFLELARLEPGVGVESVANSGSFGNNYQRVAIAGATFFQTRISVDGSTIEDRINGGTAQNFSQETVQEFQISSFGFDLASRHDRVRGGQYRHQARRQ